MRLVIEGAKIWEERKRVQREIERKKKKRGDGGSDCWDGKREEMMRDDER
jgi:hypothetical protein